MPTRSSIPAARAPNTVTIDLKSHRCGRHRRQLAERRRLQALRCRLHLQRSAGRLHAADIVTTHRHGDGLTQRSGRSVRQTYTATFTADAGFIGTGSVSVTAGSYTDAVAQSAARSPDPLRSTSTRPPRRHHHDCSTTPRQLDYHRSPSESAGRVRRRRLDPDEWLDGGASRMWPVIRRPTPRDLADPRLLRRQVRFRCAISSRHGLGNLHGRRAPTRHLDTEIPTVPPSASTAA